MYSTPELSESEREDVILIINYFRDHSPLLSHIFFFMEQSSYSNRSIHLWVVLKQFAESDSDTNQLSDFIESRLSPKPPQITIIDERCFIANAQIRGSLIGKTIRHGIMAFDSEQNSLPEWLHSDEPS